MQVFMDEDETGDADGWKIVPGIRMMGMGRSTAQGYHVYLHNDEDTCTS